MSNEISLTEMMSLVSGNDVLRLNPTVTRFVDDFF